MKGSFYLKPGRHWLMLIPLALSGLWFYLMEQIVLSPPNLMYTPLDSYIPFTPVFVVPYVAWYGYVGLTACYLFVRAPREFTKMALFLALGMMAACVVFTFYPNGQALRPRLNPSEDFFKNLILELYRRDTPPNSAPSIHVVYSVAAHAAIASHRRDKPRWINTASLITAVLCGVSTVFIKQHSIIDVIAGLALSAALYLLLYRRDLWAGTRRVECS